MKPQTKNKILISVIVVLSIILIYGVYTGFKVKAELISLNSQIIQLTDDKIKLTDEKNSLQTKISDLDSKYNLLEKDVQKIYKTCLKENACKGRFPSVSWYCNNVGDEVADYSHICVCDSSCNLNATEIKK
jgi:cell division protein FtsB